MKNRNTIQGALILEKVKNLKGKALWEKVMIAKRRKTIVLCKSCHDKIHNRSSHND